MAHNATAGSDQADRFQWEAAQKLTEIDVDGDASPVREEIYRVAARLRLNVFVVSNGSRPIRPPSTSNVSMVPVGDTADESRPVFEPMPQIVNAATAAKVRKRRFTAHSVLS